MSGSVRNRSRRREFSLSVVLGLALLLVTLIVGPAQAVAPDVAIVVPLAAASVQQLTPAPATYVTYAFRGSPLGDITGPVEPVNIGSLGSGCQPIDFAGFPAGSIALIRRGTCSFSLKVDNAIAAGAIGAIIFNHGIEGQTDAFVGVLLAPSTIPVVSASTADGLILAQSSSTVRVTIGGPFPGSVPVTYAVNRGPKAIAGSTCTLDGVSTQCGALTNSSKNGVTFAVTVTGFGSGTHTFVVDVYLTDGNTVSGSVSFEGG